MVNIKKQLLVLIYVSVFFAFNNIIFAAGLVDSEPVKIAIIDTGVDQKRISEFVSMSDGSGDDFEEVPIAGGYNAAQPYITSGENTAEGAELSYNENVADDNIGHGSTMVGIYSSVLGDELKDGDVEIYIVKVTDDNGNITDESLARGLKWAREHDMDIVNISLGDSVSLVGNAERQSVKDEINKLSDNGTIVIAATSNKGESYLGDNNINYIANQESVFSVGALNILDNNNSIAEYSSGTATGNVDFYASEYFARRENTRGGTSSATALTGALIVNQFLEGDIPESYDSDNNGILDPDEVKNYMNSPDLPQSDFFISTQSATYQMLHNQGFNYDKNNNTFVTSDGEIYISPMALNILDDAETIQRNMQEFSRRQISDEDEDLYRQIGVVPYINMYNSETPAEGEDANAFYSQLLYARGLNLEDAGFEWVDSRGVWTSLAKDETGEYYFLEITPEELRGMGADEFQDTERRARLHSLGFSNANNSLVSADGELITEEALTIMSEEDFRTLIADNGGSGGTFIDLNPNNDEYRGEKLLEAGYRLLPNGSWVADANTHQGALLMENGVIVPLNNETIFALSDDEFANLIEGLQLLAAGYQYDLQTEQWLDPNGDIVAVGNTITILDGTAHIVEIDTGHAVTQAGAITDAPRMVDVIGKALNALLQVFGFIAIISLVGAGLIYMFTGGNQDRAESAKKAIFFSVIGVTVSLGSMIILKIIIKILQ